MELHEMNNNSSSTEEPLAIKVIDKKRLAQVFKTIQKKKIDVYSMLEPLFLMLTNEIKESLAPWSIITGSTSSTEGTIIQ